MKHRINIHTVFSPLSFAMNILMVYVMYFVCRIVYYAENSDAFSLFSDDSSLWLMFRGSLMFDTSAILYTNAPYALMMLLPVPLLAGKGRYECFSLWWKKTAKWMFIVVNSLCCYINLADAAYFQFTGRRTTCSVFQEFSNENNITGILFTEFLRHWYLVIIGIIITFTLIKLYSDTNESVFFNKSRQSRISYFIARVVCILVFIPLCIGGMRGGLTHAVRPITISNANQYANTPADATLILNTPFSMLRTITKKTFVDPKYFSNQELDAIYSPLKVSNNKEMQKKNVVVLIVESFGKEYIGALNKNLDGGNYKGYTPFVDKLIEKSLTFEYSFANGRKSIDGMPSILSSIPMFVEPFFLTPSSMNDISGIAGELGKQGYHTAFFHGAENGSMGFEAFAKSTKFNSYFGRNEFNSDKRFNGDKDFDGTWAIWDEPFLQFYAKKMSELKEPFMTAVFTASSHHPFVVPDKYKNVYCEEGDNLIHKCIRYTDHSLEEFFRTAEKEPWFNNTIFVMTSDHTNMSDHSVYQTDLGVYTAPIIIYDPSGDIKPGCSNVIAQQIDIMPTILNYLGYPHSYVAFGKDLLNTAPEESWAVNYNNGIYQYLKDGYFIQFDGERLKGVYRYQSDPLLKHNLVKDLQNDEKIINIERELKAIIQSYMQRMINNELILR